MSKEYFLKNVYLSQLDKSENDKVQNFKGFNNINHFKSNQKRQIKIYNVNQLKSNKFASFNLTAPIQHKRWFFEGKRQLKTAKQQQKKLQNIRKICFQKCLKTKYNINEAGIYVQSHKIKNKRFSIAVKTSQWTTKNKNKQLFNLSNDSLINIQSITQKFMPSDFISIKQYKQICQQQKRKINDQKNKSNKRNTFKPQEMFKTSLSFRLKQGQNQVFTPQTNSKIRRINSLNPKLKQNKYKRILENQKKFQQKIQKEKQEILQLRKQLNKNYAKPFNPPSNITAQSYMVYETTKKNYKFQNMQNDKEIQKQQKPRKFQNSYKVLASHNSWTPVQIASLTKIMTFAVVIQICQKLNLNPKQQYIQIGQFQCNISGTSAELKKGQVYTLYDLFFALMLPSGNDASLSIAIWGGKVLLKKQQNQYQIMKKQTIQIQYFVQRFVLKMNQMAKTIGMQRTRFVNTHGLTNPQNKSCSFDLCLLCQYSMKKAIFRQVVGTKTYECFFQKTCDNLLTECSPLLKRKILNNCQQNYSQAKQNTQYFEQFREFTQYQDQNYCIKWQNTHFLLQQYSFYKGIKTGITSSAGPCLSSYLVLGQREFIIIVLNCKSLKQRFKDTQLLRKWIIQKQGLNQFEQLNNNFEELKDR